MSGFGSQRGTASPDEELTPDGQYRQAYSRCMRWLGQRDHSSVEISRKLGTRGVDEGIIGAVLQELREARYVDDERYALTLAEQRSRRGYGPRYISAKLVERGIERAVADLTLETLEVSWLDVACQALLGRFDREQLADESQRQQAKMARFLQARGFASGDALRGIRLARLSARADVAEQGADQGVPPAL